MNTPGKLLATLEGGYNLSAIAPPAFNTISVMAGSDLLMRESSVPEERVSSRALEVIQATRTALTPYWEL